MSLLKYAFRRILSMIPVLFGVLTLTFIFSRLMPGNPAVELLAARGHPAATMDQIAHMEHVLGLDQPIYLQYFRYLGELFTGNWGVSISYVRNADVWALVWDRLPITIDLTVFSMIIASYIGIKIGVTSSTHRNKPRDTIFRGISLIGVAIPIFFMGMLLQYFLAYKIPIFDATGYKTARFENPPYVTGFILIDSLISGEIYKFTDYLYHLILPVFCLSFITVASITRQTRSSMLEVLEQDYIRTARAKGCKEKTVIHTHALKNSLIPTVTVIGFNIAYLLSGAVLTESTFGLNGLGMLYVNAVVLYDFWLLNAVVFVITLIFIFATFMTDLLYAILDPRIRY